MLPRSALLGERFIASNIKLHVCLHRNLKGTEGTVGETFTEPTLADRRLIEVCCEADCCTQNGFELKCVCKMVTKLWPDIWGHRVRSSRTEKITVESFLHRFYGREKVCSPQSKPDKSFQILS